MRIIYLLFKHLLRLLCGLVGVVVGARIGKHVTDYIYEAMVRVPGGTGQSSEDSIFIYIIFFTIVLLGLAVGVAVPVILEHGFGASKQTYLSSLLPLLGAVVGLVLGTVAGGMITESRYRAQHNSADFGPLFAFAEGIVISFIVLLIISVVLLALWEYKRSER